MSEITVYVITGRSEGYLSYVEVFTEQREAWAWARKQRRYDEITWEVDKRIINTPEEWDDD